MTHEVFLSFRGEAMRKTFVSHLLSSLKSHDIKIFTASEPFEDVDLQAMKQSLVAITVVSQNCATSDRWVDDLARIIECEQKGTLTAIPIFFQVHPLDMLRYVDKHGLQNESSETARNWLYSHVSRKSSFHASDWKDDSELVDIITSFVSAILVSSSSSYQSDDSLIPKHSKPTAKLTLAVHKPLKGTTKTSTMLQGSPPFRTINSSGFLARGSRAGRSGDRQELRELVLSAVSTVVGICGVEGVGKKTLARHVSEEISPQFQYHCFLSDFSNNRIRRQDIKQNLLEIVATEAFKQSKPFNTKNEAFKQSSYPGSSDDAIKEMIGNGKVLLLVDGVDESRDLKGIMKDARRFGPGSKIIAITQERSLLLECGVKHIYEVECPRYEEALSLFSEFAFKQRNPLPGFEALSFWAVRLASRLPLALKLLGSFLHDRDKDEWESKLRKIEASHDEYASEVSRYIGVDDYAPRRPIIVDRHIGVDEANLFPLYCLALK